MTYFIIATRRTTNDEGEIIAYRYITNLSNTPIEKTKLDFWNLVKDTYETDKFYSYNIKLDTKVECKWRHYAGSNVNFLQSDPDGTKKNNLLELPIF